MKFYFKAHYTTGTRRIGFFKRLFAPELISLAVTADNGERFFAINTDFSSRYANNEEMVYIDTLPALLDNSWRSMKEIVRMLIDFVYANDKTEAAFNFVHDNDEVGCVIIRNMLAPGHNLLKFTNLSQTVEEYVDQLKDDDFGILSQYGLELMKDGNKNYTIEQKLKMFETHSGYPDATGFRRKGTEEATWIKEKYKFIKSLKNAEV